MSNPIKTVKSLPSTGNYLLDKTMERFRKDINDQLNIKTRRRQYNLVVTGTNAKVNRAVGSIEEVMDESNTVRYWLDFSISITLSTAAAAFTGKIDGLTFKEDTAIAYSDKDATDNLQQGYAIKDTGNLYGESSGTTTAKLFSGRVELKQKPTWY
jgi:hypothetical protein